MNKVKTVFILGKYPNPRLKKRINTEKKLGKVALISWDMGSINYNYSDEDVDFYPIKLEAERTNPLKRILPTLLFMIKTQKKLYKLSPEILHVENIDMLLNAFLYYLFKREKPKIIYEVADLHGLIIDTPKFIWRKIIKCTLRKLEKYLCSKISLLILTSEKFYDVYYQEFVDQEKMIFMPNMPDLKAFRDYKKKQNGKFTIGFIGNVRYKKQMKMLIDAAGDKDVNLLFAGFSYDNEIENYCKNKSYVKVHGKYDYDKDIAKIYSQVDCVYSVYNANDNNVKIALPNKLYESIYCKLPIIVAKGTYLSELVESMGVGVSVSHENTKDLEKAIDKILNNEKYYNKLVNACKQHKKDIDVSKYNSKLLNRLKNIL